MPVDPDDQRALALAQSAMHRADQAARVASDASVVANAAAEKADAAIAGYRSVYRALGDLAKQIASMQTGQSELAELLGRFVASHATIPAPALPEMRDRAASVHDVEEMVTKATKTIETTIEKTASHVVLPSTRVEAIVERKQNAQIVAALKKVAAVVLPAIVTFLIGRFLK